MCLHVEPLPKRVNSCKRTALLVLLVTSVSLDAFSDSACRCTVQYPHGLQGIVRCISAPMSNSQQQSSATEGHVVLVPEQEDCAPYDATRLPVRGGIVLVHRGRCTFAQKAAHAQAAGAAAMVLINSNDDLNFFLQVQLARRVIPL